jgi:DNA-binding NarL/FixJ family response regulator
MNNDLKILVVEDNPMHQKVLSFLIKKYFTQNVIITSNPKEAFPELRKSIPDFIILDIEMPYMSGKEMLELLRNMEGYADIKVIVYSSKVDKETVKKVISYNILDIINKGADQKVILSKLRKHFVGESKKESPNT